MPLTLTWLMMAKRTVMVIMTTVKMKTKTIPAHWCPVGEGPR